MVLFGPFAGVLVDPWDRRHALLVAHAGGAACSLVLALLHWFDAIGPATVMLRRRTS
jgi:MFS family permease